jgi:phage shock protein C
MKTCPYCAEPIQDAAIKCRHCGSALTSTPLSREWYRSRRGKRIAGVCAGLAEEFGISATPIRLAFVLLTVMGGPGLILYAILWIIMPYREHPRATIESGRTPAQFLDERSATFLDRG